MGRLTDLAAATVYRFLAALVAPLGDLLRAVHLKIGHGVASCGAFIMVGLVVYAVLMAPDETARDIANQRAAVELEAARDRYARESQKVALPTFDELAVSASPAGATFQFRVVAGSTALVVLYRAEAEPGPSGILDVPHSASAGSVAALTVPASSFGAAWASGKAIGLEVGQRTPEGTTWWRGRQNTYLRVP